MRITGYSRPPPKPVPAPLPETSQDSAADEAVDPAALIWHLPVIHFNGESTVADSSGPQSTRKIKGTVKMIGDGAVLWTLVGTFPFLRSRIVDDRRD